jgi:hypothetical protein
MMSATAGGKTALKTTVCETSGYFAILAAAPEKFPVAQDGRQLRTV